MAHVAIIGGGFAGLAAAIALAEGGVRVTVLEARQRLGGRASSWRDPASGAVVDNGQHVLMGCYHRTLAFLGRIGAADAVRRQPAMRVELAHPRLGAGVIACPSWPSPLHLAGGLLGYRLLSRAERVRALRGGLALMAMRRRRDPLLAAATVTAALDRVGQLAGARERFWHPIALATLNDDPDRAAAGPFVEVLARAFFRSRADSEFVLPRVGLGDLYTGAARRRIEEGGGQVWMHAQAAALEVSDGRVRGVRLRDGRRLDVDGCVAAIPPSALAALAPVDLQPFDGFAMSPIVSVHCWFDRPVLSGDFLGLLGTTTHWAFDRRRLLDEPGDGHGVGAVISAAWDVVAWDADRITATVVADLRAVVPAARDARLVHAVVVKEKQATVSPTPAAERRRPPARTALRGFVLAGDWTATGLPPTIESAVESGERAAAILLDAVRVERRRAG